MSKVKSQNEGLKLGGVLEPTPFTAHVSEQTEDGRRNVNTRGRKERVQSLEKWVAGWESNYDDPPIPLLAEAPPHK